MLFGNANEDEDEDEDEDGDGDGEGYILEAYISGQPMDRKLNDKLCYNTHPSCCKYSDHITLSKNKAKVALLLPIIIITQCK